ncbi:MAG TPA: serine protease [Gemmatimonadales bacterium]
MSPRRFAPLLALAALLPSIGPSQQRPAGVDIPTARKAVVTIHALDPNGRPRASGTGFFVVEGYVLTAAHVLVGASGCSIELSDGQRLRCSVTASDTAKDVAMLMVPGTPPATLRWGSSEAAKDGDEVTVISNPLGQLPGTVSKGIVSASRVVSGTKLLQISAPISHGSSGAPVLNARGQVIGIVRSTIEAGQALNFATATDAVRNLNNDQTAVAEGAALLGGGGGGGRPSAAPGRPGTAVSGTPVITVGQSLSGALSAADSLYADTTYFEVYQFTAPAGQAVTIDLASDDFDPVLIIRGDDLERSIINDDGGPGCSARVSQAFPSRGPYRILVNTTSSPHRQTGRYTLAITDGPQTVQERGNQDCQPPGRANVAAQGGTAIRLGQTVNAALTSVDSLYPDTTYFRAYQFTATPARDVTVDLSSDDFDPVLIIRGDDLDRSVIDDDGGPGCAARVSRSFPSRGPYRILVNTTSNPHRQTGRFSLSITEGSKPVQERGNQDCQAPGGAAAGGAPAPGGTGSASRSIAVGQTQQGTLTRDDVMLTSDSTYAQPWVIQGRAGQTITIDLESDDFDAYVFLRGPGVSGGRDFQDDDSGGNCNARLTVTFPQSGAYEIDVNTAGKFATGAFSLSVTSGSKPKSVARCSRSQ